MDGNIWEYSSSQPDLPDVHRHDTQQFLVLYVGVSSRESNVVRINSATARFPVDFPLAETLLRSILSQCHEVPPTGFGDSLLRYRVPSIKICKMTGIRPLRQRPSITVIAPSLARGLFR